jgi:hypothetical protein
MSPLKHLPLFLLLVVALLPSMVEAGGKKGVHGKLQERSVYTEDDILTRPVLNVPAASIGKLGLTLDKPFNKIKAIRQLFPGHYYHLSRNEDIDDKLDLIVWKSKNYRTKQFPGWFLDELPEVFPYSMGHITQAGQTLTFKDDSGNKHLLLSFATHPLGSIDDLGNGRYSCVIMGLAWFKEENNKWVLKHFAPGIGCYGSFKTLPPIHLTKLGTNNYGIFIHNSNGGPGQVYYSTLYIHAIVDGQFKMVLKEDDVERYNTMSSTWYSQIVSLKSPVTNGFQPLLLKLDGEFKRYTSYPEYDTTDSPIELRNAIIGKDSFNFRVSRRFEYSNGKYRKVSAKYKVKKG